MDDTPLPPPQSAPPDPSPVPAPLPPESAVESSLVQPPPADPAAPSSLETSAAATPIAEPPLLPPPAPPPPPPPPPVHPFLFHGEAREYFRIWAVNTLLTLLTGGIFAAWAKVRKRRYLRSCTELLGHRFDYRADPRRLLIGNLIVVTFFLGYSLFGVVYPAIRYGVLLVGVVMLPWIVVRSVTFNAHNTAYRGMRFRFNPSLSASTMVYLLEPLLLVVTLGFYYPAWVRSKRNYLVSNHRLGDAYFRFNAANGPFYIAYILGGLILGCSVGIGATITGVITATMDDVRPGDLLQILPVLLCYGLGFFVSKHFIHGYLFNHLWNNTRLDDHRFVARMNVGRWLGLQLVNLAAIIGTAGLLAPWAVIRAQRYVASCLHFEPAGPIESIQRLGGNTGSATGDTAAEFIGLDFGL